MKNSSHTEQRIKHIQERMRRAMPEIKRQIEVYEKGIQPGNQIKPQKPIAPSKNV